MYLVNIELWKAIEFFLTNFLFFKLVRHKLMSSVIRVQKVVKIKKKKEKLSKLLTGSVSEKTVSPTEGALEDFGVAKQGLRLIFNVICWFFS